TTIFVAGNSGSSSPQSFSCRRYTLRRIEVRPGLDHIEGRLQGLRTRCSLRRLKEAARQPAAEALGAGRPGLSVDVDVEIGEAGVIRGMEQLGRLRQPDQDVGLLRLLLIVFGIGLKLFFIRHCIPHWPRRPSGCATSADARRASIRAAM